MPDLLGNGIHVRAELAQSHISVLAHHARPIQMSQSLVWIGLPQHQP